MRSENAQPARTSELDELTLRRAQGGDDRAAQVLVELYQERVFSFLSRTLGASDRALIEDTAQEAFLAVFRSLPRFAPIGAAKLSTWILTIASRRAVDVLRHRQVSTEPLTGDTPGAVASDFRRIAIARAIRAAIDALPPEYRAAFVLREYYEFEYLDIARALQIEIGTVKSRLSRARAELRVQLSELRHE